MQLTKEQLLERLNNTRNLLGENSRFAIVRPLPPGNKEGSKKRDEETQSTIGALAHIVPRDVISKSFGVSEAQTTNLKQGRPSGPGTPQEPDLLKQINEKLGRAGDTAIDKLQLALGLIDQEKLLNCKGRELSSIAKDMAIIADKARPVMEDKNNRGPQIVFYAPRFHKEEHYDVVEVKDVTQ